VMPATSFTCPECDTGLRGAENIPAGTKVRCPSCSAVFLMPEWKGVASSQAIRKTPMSSSAPSRPSHEGGVNEHEPPPRSKRRARPDEDGEPPRRRSRADEDDVAAEEYVDEETRDDEDGEDRPPKKRRKKKKSQKSGKGLLIGVVAGSVAALAG